MTDYKELAEGLRLSAAEFELPPSIQSQKNIRAIDRMNEAAQVLSVQLPGYQKHLRACEQIAGKALGYPWFKDDQKHFPGATEEDGVCIGEHVGDTIVEELAQAKIAMAEALRSLADSLEINVKALHRGGLYVDKMVTVLEQLAKSARVKAGGS